MKLPDLEAEFEKRDTIIVAVTSEERNMDEHALIANHFEEPPPFQHAPDIGRKATAAYERTSSYLIDKQGIVREVFPMEIYGRAPWWSVLRGMDAALR